MSGQLWVPAQGTTALCQSMCWVEDCREHNQQCPLCSTIIHVAAVAHAAGQQDSRCDGRTSLQTDTVQSQRLCFGSFQTHDATTYWPHMYACMQHDMHNNLDYIRLHKSVDWPDIRPVHINVNGSVQLSQAALHWTYRYEANAKEASSPQAPQDLSIAGGVSSSSTFQEYSEQR